jgi:hypothetical protein
MSDRTKSRTGDSAMAAGTRAGAKAAKGGGPERPEPAPPSERKPQPAAAPSSFPPIADYGFLSNCHTGALVAPDARRRLAPRAELRLAGHLRQPARSRGRQLPPGAVRDPRADTPTTSGRAGWRPPESPVFFNKQATCVVGPGDDVHMPRVSNLLDYEGELAIVIGQRCRPSHPRDLGRARERDEPPVGHPPQSV